MIRRPPRSTRVRSSAASDVYKRQTRGLYSGFFQAEDGIRDLRMSRGLGDVYKRQYLSFVKT
ncbi:hypothetical protein, partial [Staphylococcus aureus]